MTKQETAAYLGISERSVDKWRNKGELSLRFVKGKTRDVADFDPIEVQALKVKLESRISKKQNMESEIIESRTPKVELRTKNLEPGAIESRNSESGIVHVPRTKNLEPNVQIFAMTEDQLTAIIKQSRAEVPIERKMVLTIPEAAALSGFKEKPIRDAIRSGELASVHIGRSKQVRPDDLQAWVNSKFKK